MSDSEPEYELGDLFYDDHDERVYRVVHRMQNYDDPDDFLYALELVDNDIPGYSWWGEQWVKDHYEKIEKAVVEQIEKVEYQSEVEKVEEDEWAERIAEMCGGEAEDYEVSNEKDECELGEPERIEEEYEDEGGP